MQSGRQSTSRAFRKKLAISQGGKIGLDEPTAGDSPHSDKRLEASAGKKRLAFWEGGHH